MTKQEKFEGLCLYLPYDLNRITNGGQTEPMTIITLNDWELGYLEIKPILRPLSDLTKEIEIDGKKFVPFDQVFDELDRELCDVHYDVCDALTSGLHDIKTHIKLIPFDMMEYFLAWHFDVLGWIESGDAIDINTLK